MLSHGLVWKERTATRFQNTIALRCKALSFEKEQNRIAHNQIEVIVWKPELVGIHTNGQN